MIILDKLALKHISKIYQDGSVALENINLDLNSKEFLVIVGPSGCGKTTLLRIISGLEKPTKGEVYLDDQYANHISPKDRNVAMVFQEYPLYPNLTVFQNIAFSLKNMKFDINEIEEKINKIADILVIKDLLNLKPKYLSGGQKQKVSLAKAMIREPKFLLFDEPLASIDASQRMDLRLEIQRLYEILDITFIYVTHDQNEALSLGTKILVMNQGRIEQIGTPKTIYEKPDNLFVASFFSSPRLNLISGKIVNGNTIKLIYGEHQQFELLLPKESHQTLEPYFDKEIYFGIRSENIVSESNCQLNGEIIHSEFIGNTYINHVKIDGLHEEIIMKSPMENQYNTTQRLSIGFDIADIFLFDRDNDMTVFQYPQTNVVQGIYQNGRFIVGNQIIHFSERFAKKVLNLAFNQKCELIIPVNRLSDSASPGQIPINIKINETIKHRNRFHIDSTITETDIRFFFESNKVYKTNDIETLFFNEEDIIIQDILGNRLNSKRILSNNRTIARITVEKMKTFVHFGKAKIEINNTNIIDGFYQVELNQDTIEIISKKTTYQEIKKEFQIQKNNNVMIGSAYDEDITGNKNILFLKVDGFQEYVTIVVNNDFSVYDYPEVLLSIPQNAITIIDMSR